MSIDERHVGSGSSPSLRKTSFFRGTKTLPRPHSVFQQLFVGSPQRDLPRASATGCEIARRRRAIESWWRRAWMDGGLSVHRRPFADRKSTMAVGRQRRNEGRA
jgi:hypothetical protein